MKLRSVGKVVDLQRPSAWSRVLVSALLLTVICVAQAPWAWAEQRIALVIGNGNYQAIAPLTNPVHDGELMAATLRKVGFEVSLLVDADQDEMKRAVADFGRKLRMAGPDATGLFYYAGHGVQSQGINYLFPVDATIRDEADLDLVAVQADWVLRQLFSARNRTNIIILDACRDNPFEAAGIRQQGLAEMNAPTGTFIAYAAAPGSVALDGEVGSNSPFTGALAESIPTKGQPIEQVFKQVRVSVVGATQGRQTPWDSSSLTSEFFFEPPETIDPKELAAEQLWKVVKQSGDSVQILLFLRQYPNSAFSQEARALLQQLLEMEVQFGSTDQITQNRVETGVEPEQPSQYESELIEKAQASGVLSDYEAYLEVFPDGVFASLAAAEIEALRQSAAPTPLAAPLSGEDSASSVAEAPSAPSLPIQTALAPANKTITFEAPLERGLEPIDGRSIAQIIEGSPQYPPVEGLPESYWKEKTCKNCHAWTKPALCEQGKTYMTETGSFALEKRHPLDGFKQVLRDWAFSECQ